MGSAVGTSGRVGGLGCRLAVLGAVAVGLIAVAAGVLYLLFGQSETSRPIVRSLEMTPGDPITVGQEIVVSANAADPEGIAEAEVLVNGSSLGVQLNPDPRPMGDFAVSQLWRPAAEGIYHVEVRAVDTEGFEGQSDPLVVEALSGDAEADMDVGVQVILEGDEDLETLAEGYGSSLEEIADRTGTPPEELGEGEEVIVPMGEERGGEAPEEGDTVDGDESGPLVDPLEGAPVGPAVEAEVRERPFQELLDRGYLCVLLPGACDPRPTAFAPPTSPGSVRAVAEGCTVEISWQDRSTNEVGFRILRHRLRSSTFDLIEIVDAHPGDGERLFYRDETAGGGRFVYLVVAFNGAGTRTAGAPEVVNLRCIELGEEDGKAVIVEALTMETSDSYDRLYCYASLAGAAYLRVPHDPTEFIESVRSGWDIAAHFAGANRRPALVPAGEPLRIEAECLGRRGSDVIDLGRLRAEHPEPEWDGRELAGRSDTGGFTVTYRILPSEELATGTWPLVDPSLPSPFDLREVEGWQHCSTGAPPECSRIPEEGVAWRWTRPPGETRSLRGFRIYRRLPREGAPRLMATAYRPSHSGPTQFDGCHETAFFSVSALLASVDSTSGIPIESPRSEEIEVRRRCAGALRVILEELQVRTVSDCPLDIDWVGCNPDNDDVESYGQLRLNGQTIVWNNHCDPGLGEGCLYEGPSTTSVGNGIYRWEDMHLRVDRTYRREFHRHTVTLEEGENLRLGWSFYDHDDTNADDLWCYHRESPVRERTLEEWLDTNEVFSLRGSAEDGECFVTVRVRGVR